ncbi:hypothetical protein CDL12_23886 [Handroanthus impetiginosus]|uniref:Uncharacterized protein n=1 Tax=Handroanthus impetiginosus TaxID=429701 RepID=A0A2G9GE77_9LAMI|nr:hypothetical protein CDL12_23886 [Handroanthus impetiginosus]
MGICTPLPLSLSLETENDGNPIDKERHKHLLSIQFVFPGLPNTLLRRQKPPAIEKRSKSKVWRRAEPHLIVRQCSFLGRVQTGLKGREIVYSNLPADSSLARAFESKHGHLLSTIPPVAHVSDPKVIKNERRLYVHYLLSGATIQYLLFPVSRFFAFGYYQPAMLGQRLDFFENNQGKNTGITLHFQLVLESYQSLLSPYLFSLLHGFYIK